MRSLGLLLIGMVSGCGGASAQDAAPLADAATADADLLRARCFDGTDYMGTWIVFPDGLCRTCPRFPTDDDAYCEGLDPPLGAGCRAYCNWGLCAQKCPDTCGPTSGPDAGSPPDAGPSCVPSTGECTGESGPICDPTCGENGSCRHCVFDDECTAEYGPGSLCSRHCGSCCNPDADAGMPCNCI